LQRNWFRDAEESAVTETKTHSGLTVVMRPLGARWFQETLTDLGEVEDLLDWLENIGCEEWRVAVAEEEFEVRWR
jgi:hypothetical protein